MQKQDYLLNETRIERLQESVKERKKSYDKIEHMNYTREKLALIFVKGFLMLAAVTIIGVPLYNYFTRCTADTLSIKDTLLALSALISGPLGFVLAHYFKSESGNH